MGGYMILRRYGFWAIGLGWMIGTSAALALTTVRIVSPAPDSVARETVPIKVPISAVPNTSPTPGYVMYRIDGKFVAAVARPRSGAYVTFMWDTKAKTPSGDLGVKDGEHEIQVSVADQGGKPVGNSDRLDVFVQNTVRSAPQQVRLRYQFPPGNEKTYIEKIQVRQSDQVVFKARLVLLRTIDDLLPGNIGMMRERVDRDSAQADQGQPVPFPLAGQSVTFNLTSLGAITPGRKMERTGEKPLMPHVLFPNALLKIGQTWNAPVKLAPMFQGFDSINVPASSATHTLTNFEWEDGIPTAKIVIKLKGTAVQPPSPQTAQTLGVEAPQTPTGFKVDGERIVFFDWRRGRIIKIVDDYTLMPTESLGTVSIGGGNGPGMSSSPPGYSSPYSPGGGSRGPYSSGPYGGSRGPAGMPGGGGGGGSSVDMSSFIKIQATTQLSV